MEIRVESKRATLEVKAVEEGREVGSILVTLPTKRSGSDLARVLLVSVDEGFRRRGIATSLYEAAASEARSRGFTLASDYDPVGNAIGFWEKQVRKGRASKSGSYYVLDRGYSGPLKNPSMSLSEVYEDFPASNELIWEFVSRDEWEDKFPVVEIAPSEVVLWSAGGFTVLDAFRRFAAPGQKRLVDYYRRQGLQEAKAGVLVVDLSGRTLVDGYHRVVALALEGVPSVRAVDIGSA